MDATTPLPTGTVTFLFTDIEGSSQLWEQHPDAMRLALARHDACLTAAIQTNQGHVFKTVGDAFCAAFATARDALDAAVAAQLNLRALQPSAVASAAALSLRVRIALHTGVAEARGGDYFGLALNRVARLLAIAHGGQVLLSGATQELVQDDLPPGASLRDLGRHRLRDLQRPEQVYQLLSPDLPADFPPLRSLDAFRHNLPVQLTSFIGREREMAEAKRLLAATRLLTLTGSGGCGKTRLALEMAVDLLEEYANGVWLVELAALADAALVPQTVAAALGVREQPGRPLTAILTDYLRSRSLLLVLDNCEHLLTACAQLTESLLRACPNLRILASSREGLGVGGEQTYRVPSLSLPDTRHLPPLERLQEVEAVQLFADRARLSQATFAVTPANAQAVAKVCERLDGIPLALELAAARVKALPMEQIAARLDDRFRLLTGGSRTALPRQQTLRALIDWSYELLSEGERVLLRRLSVFAGGWTLEAAETVCAGEAIEDREVLDLLTALVEKSLVVYEEQEGEGRYRLLETIRQYGADKRTGSGEDGALRERHRDWYLGLAEQAEPELTGPAQGEWLARLETEHDNLRAVLVWSQERGDAEAGLQLAGALWRFWAVRGYLGEGRERLAELLALPGARGETAARAKALTGAGVLASTQGDCGAARALFEEGLAIERELGNEGGIATSLNNLGRVALDQGDYEEARALHQESLAVFRELGDKPGIASSLRNLGALAFTQGDCGAARALFEEGLAIERKLCNKRDTAASLVTLGEVEQVQGDYGAAQVLYEEGLTIFRELGDKRGIATSLIALGEVARWQGDYGAARPLYDEGLAIFRELGDKRGIAASLLILGWMALNQGDYEVARAWHEESLAIQRERGHKRGIAASLSSLGLVAWNQGDHGAARALREESLAIFRELGDEQSITEILEGLAAVAVAQGAAERAARLFGAAAALREAIGAPLPPDERADYERQVAPVRAALHEAAFAAAWAEGRAMSLDDAIAFALEVGGSVLDERG